MKKITKIFVSVLFALGTGYSVNAQVLTSNENALVSAIVMADIAVTKDVDINFGQVKNSVIPTLNAADASDHTEVGNTATLGKFTVTGTATANVTVTFDPVTMENTVDNTKKLLFTPSVYRTNLNGASAGTISVANDSDYLINNSNTGATPGTDYFFVGGTLSATTSAATPIPQTASGVYEGSFVLTVVYN